MFVEHLQNVWRLQVCAPSAGLLQRYPIRVLHVSPARVRRAGSGLFFKPLIDFDEEEE
jgi:hypothetical protein